MKKLKINLLLSFLLLIFCNTVSCAVQSIVIVPSSDIIPFGDIIIKESNRFKPFGQGKYVTLTPAVTFGSGLGTEITTGVATSISTETRVRADLAAKKVFVRGANRFTVGTRLNPYLTSSDIPESFTYAHFSTKIKKTKTTLTSGMYIAGNKHYLPDKPGVILGMEQVIIRNKLRLAMDWTSRNESYGLIGVALKYRPVPTLSITNGIVIPNGNKGKLAFLISISKNFSIID